MLERLLSAFVDILLIGIFILLYLMIRARYADHLLLVVPLGWYVFFRVLQFIGRTHIDRRNVP